MNFRFKILLEKNEILTSTSTNALPKRQKFHFKDFLPRQATLHLISRKQPLRDKNFIFKTQGREKGIFLASDSPPPGYYNCNYSIVHKSPVSVTISKEIKKKDSPPTPDRLASWTPTKKMINISFVKQVPRKDHFVKILNENRFLSFEAMPKVCTKYKKSGSPDISKFSHRKSLQRSAQFLPSYRPSYKLVKEDTSKAHEFIKYTSRKPLFLENAEEDYFSHKEILKSRKWEDYWQG